MSSLAARILGPLLSPSAAERACRRLARTARIGGVASFACGLLYAFVGSPLAAAVTVAAGAAFIALSYLPSPRNVELVMLAVIAAALAPAVVISRDLGGFTSPAMVWLPILVRSTYLVAGRRVAVPSVGLMAIALVVVHFVERAPVVSANALEAAQAGSLLVALLASLAGAAAEERLSREANATLENARDAAESTSRLKSEFVATVSHELKTPLHAIVGMSRLLLDGKLDDKERRDAARVTRAAADNLVVLVDDLLDMSRLEAGQVTLQPAPCDLRAVVGDVRDLVEVRAREKELRFDVELPAQPVRVVADAARLRQVLTNLVDNAVKFTEQGHVRFALHVEHLEPAAAKRVQARFVVEDTGIGIPAEKLGVIFERFRQADSSTTRRFGGTGLGLAIAKDLVRLMDGALDVVSAPGAGSTFTVTVTLPLAAEAGSLEGTRVLLAEDNVVNQRLAVLLLTSLGCKVDVASDGVEAVRLAGEREYDVVLMDCYMPEMDGYRAAAAIRERVGPSLPIFALTAAGSAEDVQRARAAGMNELLQKPIDVEGIRASLARVV